jgi:GntR family histidine utilization transcriptional repressor
MGSSKTPIYDQVKAFVRQRISQGLWKPGDPVPSESALMQQFGVSRMTVNRALRELVSEGLVRRVQGSGTFVAELSRISSRLEIRDICEEVTERGHLYAARVLKTEKQKATSELGQQLGLRSGATVFHSLVIHFENGIPILYEDRYVNPAAAPDYLSADFTQVTPTRHLLEHAPLTEASYSIEASLPSAEEARHLKIARSEPCLVVVRRTVSGPRVASLGRLVYPGSRHNFAGNFQA